MNERAFVAHLIPGIKAIEGAYEAWAKLSEKRLMELKSGKLKGVS